VRSAYAGISAIHGTILMFFAFGRLLHAKFHPIGAVISRNFGTLGNSLEILSSWVTDFLVFVRHAFQ